MAYLRGSKYPVVVSRPWRSKAPSLKNKVEALERKVNRQQPERQYFHYNSNTPLLTGWNFLDVSVTDLLIAAAGFRDSVTGDQWKNAYLRVNIISTNQNLTNLRMVCYTHRRAGTAAYNFPGSINSFIDGLDPTQITVYSDRHHSNLQTNLDLMQAYFFIPLKYCMTEYNSETATVEKNNIRVAFSMFTNAVSQMNYEFQLCYYNK